MSRDKQQTEENFAAMVESRMCLWKTSGIWIDDSPEREWLVIYAGEDMGETGKTYQNRFMVESPSIFYLAWKYLIYLGSRNPACGRGDSSTFQCSWGQTTCSPCYWPKACREFTLCILGLWHFGGGGRPGRHVSWVQFWFEEPFWSYTQNVISIP